MGKTRLMSVVVSTCLRVVSAQTQEWKKQSKTETKGKLFGESEGDAASVVRRDGNLHL